MAIGKGELSSPKVQWDNFLDQLWRALKAVRDKAGRAPVKA